MSVETSSARYRFTPHVSVCMAVNVEFGKLDSEIIPDYYRPSEVALKISDALIDLAVNPKSGVELVFAGECGAILIGSMPRSGRQRILHRGGLETIIGPENLQSLVGDENGNDSLLWPRGEVNGDTY